MHHESPTVSGGLTFSFVVPALNEARLLGRLLDSIEKQDQSEAARIHEILVVDAESSDATTCIARNHGCTVLSAGPGHVSQSRNIGAQHATGDIVAFADADCELPQDWLSTVAAQFRDDSVVAVGSAMAPAPRGSVWVEESWFELAHRVHEVDIATDVDWLATFNIAIRRDSLEDVGRFDESLETCEDVDLGMRLSKSGRLLRLNHSLVIHNGESKSVSEFYRREAWRASGAFRHLRRHWNSPREFASFLLPFFVVFGLCVGIIFGGAGIVALGSGAANAYMLLTLAAISGLLPVLLLTARRRVPWRFIPRCAALLGVYFVARCHGVLRSTLRVTR